MPNYGGIKRSGEEGDRYQPKEEVVKNGLERLRAGSYENALDALVDLRVVLGLPPLSEEQLGEIQDAIRLIDPYAQFPPNVENCSSERHKKCIYDIDGSLATVQAPKENDIDKYIKDILELVKDRLFFNTGVAKEGVLPTLFLLRGLDIAHVVPYEQEYRFIKQIRMKGMGESLIVIRSDAWWLENNPVVIIDTDSLYELLSRLEGMEVNAINMGGETILQTTKADHYLSALIAGIRRPLELIHLYPRFSKIVEAIGELSKSEMARLLGYEGYSYAVIEAVRECCGLPPRSQDELPEDQLHIARRKGWLENGVIIHKAIPATVKSIEKPEDDLAAKIEKTIREFADVVKRLADSYEKERDHYILAKERLENREIEW